MSRCLGLFFYVWSFGVILWYRMLNLSSPLSWRLVKSYQCEQYKTLQVVASLKYELDTWSRLMLTLYWTSLTYIGCWTPLCRQWFKCKHFFPSLSKQKWMLQTHVQIPMHMLLLALLSKKICSLLSSVHLHESWRNGCVLETLVHMITFGKFGIKQLMICSKWHQKKKLQCTMHTICPNKTSFLQTHATIIAKGKEMCFEKELLEPLDSNEWWRWHFKVLDGRWKADGRLSQCIHIF
jgi:hypothetical protein